MPTNLPAYGESEASFASSSSLLASWRFIVATSIADITASGAGKFNLQLNLPAPEAVMSAIDVATMNRQLANKLLDDAKLASDSPYAGKFVGIANGQIVAVADDWDDLARRLRQAEPDPTRTFGVEVGRDYSEVQQIWELR